MSLKTIRERLEPERITSGNFPQANPPIPGVVTREDVELLLAVAEAAKTVIGTRGDDDPEDIDRPLWELEQALADLKAAP